MKKQFTLLSIIGTLSLLVTSCNGHVRKSSFESSNETHSSANSNSSQESDSSTQPSSSKEEPRTFTITWKNEDDLILEIDQNVNEGEIPTFDGQTPTKPNDAQYNYVFSGWTPEVVAAHADATYTATYQEELRKYTVIWKDEDGTVIETDENVPYGTIPEFNDAEPSKESTAQYNYSFVGWSPEVSEVNGDVVYTATYQEQLRSYTVTWKDENGVTLKTEKVAYGTVPNYGLDDPIKESTAQYSYTFNGWTPNVVAVTEDVTYVATYLEQVRTYTITWINYDGTVLEVDTGVEYGATPSFNSEVPYRANIRGADYSFKGWEPEISPVEKDQTYTAVYDVDAYFSFDILDYELENGYSLSDLRGAPWVNVNLQGEINKIKKPSLKDDFYTAVNYESIKNGELGPFELDSMYVSQTFENIFNNSRQTTNGAIVKSVYDKVLAGDISAISTYFANMDLETYLSSKDVFLTPSSYLQLNYIENTGYEIEYNDGYLEESLGLHTLWFYSQFSDYSFLESPANSLASKVSQILGFDLSSSDISQIESLDRNLSYQAFYDSYYSEGEFVSYTVNTLPWSQVKTALLSMGLEGTDKVNVKDYYLNVLNYLFNDFAINDADTVKKDIMARVAFDYRFLLGANNYRTLNQYIVQARVFNNENYLGQMNGTRLARELTKLVVPAIFEQSYIELQSNENIKAGVASLIEDILYGYLELFDEIDWLSTRTKRNVVRKLQYMSYVSCYSDFYKNFAKIDDTNISSSSLFNIYTRYTNTAVNQAINHVYKDETAWIWDSMPSYTVNAFYTAAYNSFVILNGIVPAFISDCVEELYGMLGFVIGHEITHAFDSSGSYYDENGQYNDLMEGDDRTKFNNKVNKLINFYDKITLFDNTKVDGDNVDGEATADMGGVKVMLQLAKNIPDFDYDLFFRSVAKTWCEQPYSDDYIDALLADSHPFAYLRVNVTLAQFDEFVETYGIGPGDGMYIPKEERVKIW